MRRIVFVISLLLMVSGCSSVNKNDKSYPEGEPTSEAVQPVKDKEAVPAVAAVQTMTNSQYNILAERFNVPEGFERVKVDAGSFQEYLRSLPLEPYGSKVRYYDGREKQNNGVYEAVVSGDIGNRDLHQCADAVMLLRAEYLFKNGRFDEIHFNFVGGFKAEYSKWRQGWRIKVNGDDAYWIKSTSPSNSYENFRKYMDIVFAYAGTLSLEKELKPVKNADMSIGDVFIKGASPGHAVIVVDMALNRATGEKLFMLAQSYMPAQQTQILCNNGDKAISPWYSLNYPGELHTPEWTFGENTLRRFQGE